MKKVIKSMLAIAIAAFAFTSCEDVPEPYTIPGTGGGEQSEGSLPYTSSNLSDGWSLVSITEGQPWSQGSTYTQATGYQAWGGASSKSNQAVEGWLISPAFVTTGYENVKISFDNTIRYTNNVSGWEANHKVYASNDFNGTDVNTATWVELAFKPVASPYNDWTLYTSGEIQLPESMTNAEKVYIGFWFKAPATASTTWELENFKIEEGIATGDNGNENPDDGNTIGTKDAPITTAKAIELINALDEGGKSTEKAYVKGKIVKVTTNADNFAKYGNLNYYISDDGTATNQVQVYAGDGLNGAKFTSITDIKAGDEVVVYGTLYKFINKSTNAVVPEITDSYLASYTAGGGDTPNPQPDESNLEAGKYFFVYKASTNYEVYNYQPFNGNSYGYMYPTKNSTTIAEDGTLTGDEADLFTFTAVEGGFTLQDAQGQYLYMDDSHNSFQVSATQGSGNYVWSAFISSNGTATVKNVGTGKSIQYVSKYTELCPTNSGDGLPLLVKQGGKISEGGNGNPDPQPGNGTFGVLNGNVLTLTAADLGVDNGKEPGTINLVDGTKITFDGGGNSNTPKYYTTGASLRMYPKNSLTITANGKTISSVTLNCTEQSGTLCNASEEVGAQPGTVAFDGAAVNVTGINSGAVTITNSNGSSGAASQLRFATLVITYSE
ncbi:MAG: DUF5017 domain-containing protein [Prevotella sp.]|nr:DUF5017 domain-containing protein [Prevotella sp.]